MLLSSSTHTSIRNQIQKDRWWQPEISRGERNQILAWDDVDYAKLSNDGMYTMLKGGYSRSSSTITIAGKDGENLTFDVFGGRIMSSVSPFFGDSKLSELSRRMIVFPTAKSTKSITDFDEINWKGVDTLTYEIWRDKSNIDGFVANKKKVRSYLKKSGVLSVDRANLFVDILSTGITLGLFDTANDAYQAIFTHEQSMRSLSEKQQDNLSQVLIMFIQECQSINPRSDSRVYLRPDKLKEFISKKVKEGELDGFPRKGELPECMRTLGFVLDNRLRAWVESV